MPLTSSKTSQAAVAAACVVALVACGPRSVQGSLSVISDMTYESVELVRGGSDITLRFTKPRGGGEDLVLAVAARGVTFPDAGQPGPTWDLAEVTGFGQRGALSRNVLNDPNQTFPTIDRGHFHLNSPPGFGQMVSGDFAVTFIVGTDFGCGRTLYSNFSGRVR